MRVGLPLTTPEQRSSLYEDLETLLDFGFLSYTLSINGVMFSFRSLTPGDQFVLRHRTHGTKERPEEFRTQIVAASIWMVDGYNLLGETNVVPKLANVIRGLPGNARIILFNVVLRLFDRVSKAVDAVESYAYEKASRYKWRTMGGQSFGTHTGVPGVPTIGTNYAQRMWTFFNTMEDQRVADDSLWEGFKLTASAQAPKGVKKIDARDKQQRQLEIDRRQGIFDRFFYTAKGVIKPIDRKNRSAATEGPHMGPKTADDLAEEMRRWVAGEDDWHDAIVTSYKQQVSAQHEQHKAEAAERAAALAAVREEESDRPQVMVAYTADQLAEILRERNPGPAGVRVVDGGINMVRDHLYEKYIGRAADPGALRVMPDGQMAIADAPIRVGLDQRAAKRQVPYRTQPEDPDEDEPVNDPHKVLPNEW